MSLSLETEVSRKNETPFDAASGFRKDGLDKERTPLRGSAPAGTLIENRIGDTKAPRSGVGRNVVHVVKGAQDRVNPLESDRLYNSTPLRISHLSHAVCNAEGACCDWGARALVGSLISDRLYHSTPLRTSSPGPVVGG